MSNQLITHNNKARVTRVNKTTKNMDKPENQQLFCSMDQGATETDLIPNKQEQNILNPTNLLNFVVKITLILEPITVT